MAGPIDLGYILFFSVVLALFEHYVFFPRFRAALAAGKPNARINAYRRALTGQWLITAGAFVIWLAYARPVGDLGFALPHGWRLSVGLGIIIGSIAFAAAQIVSVRRASPPTLAAIRPKLDRYAFLLPHHQREFRWFSVLAFTAGFCEELLYRGYLGWVLHWWMGWVGAIAFGVALFGVAHAYQGAGGAIRATLAGVFMGAVFLVTQWVVPAMVAHAMIDFGSGWVGYLVFRGEIGAPATALGRDGQPSGEPSA